MYTQLFFVTRCDVIKFIPMFTVVVINHNCHNLFRKKVVVSIRSICIKLWCFISPLQCLRHSFDLWSLYLKESTNYQDPHLLLNIPMMTLWCLSSQQCHLKYVGNIIPVAEITVMIDAICFTFTCSQRNGIILASLSCCIAFTLYELSLNWIE